MAGERRFGLHPRREHLRGWRDDAVSRFRNRRLRFYVAASGQGLKLPKMMIQSAQTEEQSLPMRAAANALNLMDTPISSGEWLEVDGVGGFASGTSTGIRTRR